MASGHLLRGQLVHARKGGPLRRFRHALDLVLIDPEAPPPQAMSLWGRNRRRPMAIWDRDHGGPPGQGEGAPWARRVFQQAGIEVRSLRLLAQPRILGAVFNPAAFWLALNDSGQLIAVIAEVSNTFGQRHSYLCRHPDQRPIAPGDHFHAEKVFHVSPFQPLRGSYRFRFDLRAARIGVFIDYEDGAGGGLYAALTGNLHPLGTGAILASLVARPLAKARVLGLIHWHALRLWMGGAEFHPCPAAPQKEVSL